MLFANSSKSTFVLKPTIKKACCLYSKLLIKISRCEDKILQRNNFNVRWSCHPGKGIFKLGFQEAGPTNSVFHHQDFNFSFNFAKDIFVLINIWLEYDNLHKRIIEKNNLERHDLYCAVLAKQT